MKNNIREIRLAKGMTLTELSRKAQVSDSWLSGLELGQGYPGTRLLEKIAGILGTTVSALLEDKPPKEEKPPRPEIAPEDSARAMAQAIAAIQRAFMEARKCSGDDLLIIKAFARTCMELAEQELR